MMIRVWLLLLTACGGLFSGCGDVDSCKQNEELGCLNSPPRADGSCLFDLVLRGSTCVKPGGGLDACSDCGEGSVCVPEENRCVNFCEAPSVLPGSVPAPEPIFCEAFVDPAMPTANPMLAFEEVCKRRCRLECRRLEQLCTEGAKCPEGRCDLPEVQAECLEECPATASGAMDLACLTQRCNDVRYARCETSLACPDGAPPKCAEITCTNDCAMGYAGDGACDDGDAFSSETPLCAWGSDCADCGARRGNAPQPGYVGAVCNYRQNCIGASGSPVDALAWCVEIAEIAGLARCAPDCSRGQACPDGFECHETLFNLGGPASEPIVEGGFTSQACFPLLCSGLDGAM